MTQPIAQPLHHPPTRVVTGTEAEHALRQMGLGSSSLTQACVEGLQSAVRSYSPFEPATSLGISIWSKVVGALRSQLNEKGWKQHDIANAPRSVSPDGTASIAAIGGDSRTARTDTNPSNARTKGPRFVNEIENNAANSSTPRPTQLQLDLSSDIEDARFTNLRTWVLLYFWDRTNHELRLELSLPTGCDKGIVTRWETRIILPTQDLSGNIDLSGSNDSLPSAPTQEVDFEITAIS